ncbi:MAG: PepSY domain-containing protein [Rhodobacteraceae bacterium]|nr:PepSY domain-containing protein [Paracoccaceae bacterium]
MTSSIDAASTQTRDRAFYFAAWRWHFYAGLYVIPFLLMLAVTGFIMLWIAFFQGIGDEKRSVVPGHAPLPVSALQSAAEAAVPGSTANQYVSPLSPEHAAVFRVSADGIATGVTLDPYTGKVMHSFPWRAGWYDLANDIHGTLLIGTAGDLLIEAAASLGLLLVITGLYLHWPRNGSGLREMLVPALNKRGRALWKSLHGVTAFWFSIVLVLFLISGLSWAGIWGEKMVQAWNTFPAEKWGAPLSDETHASMNHEGSHEVPWTLEQTPLPLSGSLAGTQAIAGPVSIDSVAAFADGLGFDRRYNLNLPGGPTGVWTISHDSMSNDGPDPSADRTIHIDRYTGNVLADVRYAEYSTYAKAMAWGIALHEGDLGLWNFALNTAFIAAMIFVSVSGLVLWWKRRPAGAGRLAAPPVPADMPMWKGAVLVALVLAMAFPMAGVALLSVIAVDLLVLSNAPRLKRALS